MVPILRVAERTKLPIRGAAFSRRILKKELLQTPALHLYGIGQRLGNVIQAIEDPAGYSEDYEAGSVAKRRSSENLRVFL